MMKEKINVTEELSAEEEAIIALISKLMEDFAAQRRDGHRHLTVFVGDGAYKNIYVHDVSNDKSGELVLDKIYEAIEVNE